MSLVEIDTAEVTYPSISTIKKNMKIRMKEVAAEKRLHRFKTHVMSYQKYNGAGGAALRLAGYDHIDTFHNRLPDSVESRTHSVYFLYVKQRN